MRLPPRFGRALGNAAPRSDRLRLRWPRRRPDAMPATAATGCGTRTRRRRACADVNGGGPLAVRGGRAGARRRSPGAARLLGRLRRQRSPPSFLVAPSRASCSVLRVRGPLSGSACRDLDPHYTLAATTAAALRLCLFGQSLRYRRIDALSVSIDEASRSACCFSAVVRRRVRQSCFISRPGL